MAVSSKERQRRWQERQKAAGRKRLTVVLGKDAYAVIMKEKEKTGESIASIINSALMLMEKGTANNSRSAKKGIGVSDNEGPELLGVSDNENGLCDSSGDKNKDLDGGVSANDSMARKRVIKRIVAMIGVVGLSESEVAERLNEEGVDTLNGFDAWDEDTVGMLYRQEIT